VKVAQLTTRYPPGPGGVERHVAELAPRLAARGLAVEVFTSDLYREFPMERLAPEVPRVESTAFGTVHRLPVVSLPGDLHYPFFRGLGRALDHARPDLLHAHTYGTNQVAVAARRHRRVGTPFVVTAHFHPSWSMEGGRLRRSIRRFYDRRLALPVLAEASRIIVQTEEERRLLDSLGLSLPDRVVIPPGFTPLPAPAGEGGPFRRAFSIPAPYVLFVGRLASNKGLLDLVTAFERVARTDPELRLVLLGADGGWASRVEARARELGVADRVHRVGFVADDALLASAYRGAVLLVLPSEYEAFGLVLLEAMTQGTPVVASRVGGIPEIVTDGATGLLVPPHDPTSLAEAIARLRADPALARRLGEAGRTDVVPRFSWEAVADRLVALYREVAER
jgi:glycosyltransferase involved in cell wall biosynthesis